MYPCCSMRHQRAIVSPPHSALEKTNAGRPQKIKAGQQKTPQRMARGRTIVMTGRSELIRALPKQRAVANFKQGGALGLKNKSGAVAKMQALFQRIAPPFATEDQKEEEL